MTEVTGLKDYDFVASYSKNAPLALALERSLESSLYSGKILKRPILDLGCGDGIFAEITFGKGVQIDYGVDPNPIEIERAKKRDTYQNLFVAFGNQIPLPDGSLSTVISNSVLEHIENVGPVLDEIRRLLRNQGELHITVPTDKFEQFATTSQILRALGLHRLDAKFRAFYNRFWQHYHAYSMEGWKNLLAKHGFTVIEASEYCSRLRAMTHDLLVPLALPAFVVNKLCKRYFFFGKSRDLLISTFRAFLPSAKARICQPGQGGLIYLRARKG